MSRAVMQQALDALTQPTGWSLPTEPQIDEYLADYEMRGEDEDGRDACLVPSDTEKAVIKDAILGLLAEVQYAPVAPDPVVVQYLSLTDAMGYDSTSNLSPEEWAADLVKRAAPVAQRVATLHDDGPRCRDCADFGPICPWSGKPCEGEPDPAPVAQCRNDGRCQYAIDSGAEGLGHCPAGKCCMPAAAQPAREPLTVPQLKAIWAHGTDGEDVYIDVLLLEFARGVERAHGIGGAA